MIISEQSLFSTIEQSVRQLDFNRLLDEERMSLFLHRKLSVHAHLGTIDDLCQHYKSIEDFVARNKGTGKRAAGELLTFLKNLESNGLQSTMPVESQIGLFEERPVAWPPEVAALPFEHLHQHGLISNILFNKLCRDAKLLTVGDFHHKFKSISEFRRKIQSVGEKVVQELTSFFESLSADPTPYLAAVEKEKDIFLPRNYCRADNVVENFKRVVDDVKQCLSSSESKSDRHYLAILEYFFTDKPSKRQYTLEEVGALLCLTGERVRQLKKEVVIGFTQWRQGLRNDLVPKCFPVTELKERIDSLFERLLRRYENVVTETELRHFFAEEQILLDESVDRAVDLLFDMYGISRCGKVETSFTETDFYILSSDFDHKSFLVTANLILCALKDEVVPLNRHELIIRVNKSLKTYKGSHSLKPGKIPYYYIDIALVKLAEIETLSAGADLRYQVRYPYLSSNAARAERILFELGGRRSFPEIMAETQTRAARYNLNDVIEEQSIRNQMLASNGRIRAHGKLGIYEWVSPETAHAKKALSRVDLVKEAIKRKGEAVTLAEIEQYVNVHLADIEVVELQNAKSTSGTISYLINRGELIRLGLGHYILKNWEPRYADQIKTSVHRSPKGKVLQEVINILAARPEKTMARRLLLERLLEAGYRQSTFKYAIINNPIFELIEENSVSFVRLKDNHHGFKKQRQQDQVRKRLTDLLLSTKTHMLPLPVVVRKLEKEFSLSRTQVPVIYKVIAASPHLFEKSESVGGQKSVKLLAVPKSSDVSFEPNEHWPEVKKLLAAKLSQRLRGIFVHSLDENLDVFFNIAMLPSEETDLEALDLLPGFIWKFFSGMSDEHFEHSLVREIATSIEPYLLKILYLTSRAHYQVYQNEQAKKGLSRINYLLTRIQYKHSQRLHDAFFKAKQTRDAAAHTAQSWSSADRSERVLACLMQILYSVDCYFAQLRSFSTPLEVAP